MSAKIRIESGISAGTNYWIDRPVLRVGSDPQCEICLPSTNLASHALTIEFHKDEYRFYNRGSSPIFANGSPVPPGKTGTWHDNDTIELPGDLRLVLAFDGDPRPCPRPMEKESEFRELSVDAEISEEVAKQKSSKSFLQIAVIGFCVAGAALFLTMEGGAETETPDPPTFEELVENSQTANAAVRARVEHLQFAEAAVVRGSFEVAKSRYSKLRDRLRTSNTTLPEEVREDGKRILEFTEYRLSQL
jgi:hypothetical protein